MARPKLPVWRGDWPIPKWIDLPGLRIRVKLVAPEEIELVGSDYGQFTYAPPTAETPYAVLYVNAKWPVELQRYIILHELQHATTELLDQMIEKFPTEVATHAVVKLIEDWNKTKEELKALKEKYGIPQ